MKTILGLLETNKLGFPVAGLPPYRLEVLVRLKGLDFDAAKLRASTVDLAGRPKDLADWSVLTVNRMQIEYNSVHDGQSFSKPRLPSHHT